MIERELLLAVLDELQHEIGAIAVDLKAALAQNTKDSPVFTEILYRISTAQILTLNLHALIRFKPEEKKGESA